MITYDTYNYRLTQLRYLRAAVNSISAPDFKPDGVAPVAVATMVTGYSTALASLFTRTQIANEARGALAGAHAAGHDAATASYACMKSCYRKLGQCLARIVRLPKQDNSPGMTLTRMRNTAECWASLPNVPGTASPLAVGDLTLAGFTTLTTALETAITAATNAGADEAAEGAAMRELDQETENFISAALAQGRAQYKDGTANRAYIDSVPTEPSTQRPDQAEFNLAESPAEGAVHLTFSADGATSFKVWHKGPGEAVFTLAADVLRPGEYAAGGLPEGIHEYKVIGVNSRGEGPESAVASLDVPEAQAA